jgi:hypothetical protein
MTPTYLHLKPGTTPPPLKSTGPFKAVVVIETTVMPAWQVLVSDWLVRSGCRYMMAWGLKCTEWDDSVEEANLIVFDWGEIPDDALVMTTWHETESLEEVFWYSEKSAMHPCLDLQHTYLVHISENDRSAELLKTFCDAQEQ